MKNPPAILLMGPTASGKSALAQRWVEAQGARRVYVATARADLGQGDAELAGRIAGLGFGKPQIVRD